MENIRSNEVAASAKLSGNVRLPLNRREVYFTATVLPGIICADNFKHFERFLDLLGVKLGPVDPTNIQFFTEYALSHTIDDEEPAAGDYDGKAQQPDVVAFIGGPSPTLIIVEGKMYSTTSRQSLIEQMDAQEAELAFWSGKHCGGAQIVHVALLPERMKCDIGATNGLAECRFGHPRPIITWEQILYDFADVTSATYFRHMLQTALDRYPELGPQGWVTGQYCNNRLLGVDIVANYLHGERTYLMVGRKGGLKAVAHDIATGEWSTRQYEVKISEEERSNWFPIEEFVKLVREGRQESA